MGPPVADLGPALEALERGGIIVLPTDTVYGLAARADRASGVGRIFALKARAPDKAVQLLVTGSECLERLGRPSEAARILAARYWPGPLTIVVTAGPDAPSAVVSNGTIGLRAPAHPVPRALIDGAGPLAASSANRSGEATPSMLAGIRATFAAEVDVYLDGGHIAGIASTVVDTAGTEPVILREGAIPAAEITRALGGRFGSG